MAVRGAGSMRVESSASTQSTGSTIRASAGTGQGRTPCRSEEMRKNAPMQSAMAPESQAMRCRVRRITACVAESWPSSRTAASEAPCARRYQPSAGP